MQGSEVDTAIPDTGLTHQIKKLPSLQAGVRCRVVLWKSSRTIKENDTFVYCKANLFTFLTAAVDLLGYCVLWTLIETVI